MRCDTKIIHTGPRFPFGKVELVDTIPVLREEDRPSIELLVRNVGARTSIIRKLELVISKTYRLYDTGHHFDIPLDTPVSFTISPERKPPYSLERTLASGLTADGVTSAARIRIDIDFNFQSCSIPPCSQAFFAVVTPILYYDKQVVGVRGDAVLVGSVGLRRIAGVFDEGNCVSSSGEPCEKVNALTISQMKSLRVKRSPNIDRLTAPFEPAPPWTIKIPLPGTWLKVDVPGNPAQYAVAGESMEILAENYWGFWLRTERKSPDLQYRTVNCATREWSLVSTANTGQTSAVESVASRENRATSPIERGTVGHVIYDMLCRSLPQDKAGTSWEDLPSGRGREVIGPQ
jgi:hypothetical protein